MSKIDVVRLQYQRQNEKVQEAEFCATAKGTRKTHYYRKYPTVT